LADDPGLIDLETTILLLPLVSRGKHLEGPAIHAQNLTKFWKTEGNDAGDVVVLALAFRLLDAEAIAGAISRAAATEGYSNRPRYWDLPGAKILLPELRKCVWQAMTDGTLVIEAIEGVRGTCHRVVTPAELPRLMPDWALSRLTLGGRDEFVGVQVWRAPSTLAATEAADTAAFVAGLIATGTMVAVEAADSAAFVVDVTRPANRPWSGGQLSMAVLKAAMKAIELDYPPDAHPSEEEVWGKLETHCGRKITRATVRSALRGSRLKGRRGYHSTKSPST
jgi:hypothetical protein